jgi:hypothetical protein
MSKPPAEAGPAPESVGEPAAGAGPGSRVSRGRRWADAEGVHIDVRGLPPPGPLVAIVALLESSDGATPVIVHHDRDPVMLYGELAERGWTAERIDASAGEVRLRLEHAR